MGYLSATEDFQIRRRNVVPLFFKQDKDKAVRASDLIYSRFPDLNRIRHNNRLCIDLSRLLRAAQKYC